MLWFSTVHSRLRDFYKIIIDKQLKRKWEIIVTRSFSLRSCNNQKKTPGLLHQRHWSSHCLDHISRYRHNPYHNGLKSFLKEYFMHLWPFFNLNSLATIVTNKPLPIWKTTDLHTHCRQPTLTHSFLLCIFKKCVNVMFYHPYGANFECVYCFHI